MGFNWKRAAGLPPMDAAYGVIPSRNRIRGLENYTLIEPCGIHENPRFYKYRWRIWALDNTDEDWKPERDDRAVLRHGFNRRAQHALQFGVQGQHALVFFRKGGVKGCFLVPIQKAIARG